MNEGFNDGDKARGCSWLKAKLDWVSKLLQQRNQRFGERKNLSSSSSLSVA